VNVESRSFRHRLSFLWSRPPLIGFFVVYAATCYAGSIALLLGPTWIRSLYVYLSGANMPHLSTRDVIVAIVLLNLGPASLVLGWLAGERITRRWAPRSPSIGSIWVPKVRVVVALYSVTVLYLLVRLTQAGAVSDLSGWVHYGSLIAARGAVVRNLSFWDFVLAYSILPLLAAALVAHVVGQAKRWREAVVRLLPVAGSLAVVNLLLFQKRSLIVAVVLPVLVVLFLPGNKRPTVKGMKPKTARTVAGAMIALYALYIVLLVAPVAANVISPPRVDRSLVFESTFADAALGWNTAEGFLLQGARTQLGPGEAGQGLVVNTHGALEGVTYDTGAMSSPGSHWVLTVAARAAHPTVLTLLIGRNYDDEVGTFTVSNHWRRYTLKWVPKTSFDHVNIAARLSGAGQVTIDDVTARRTLPVRRSGAGGVGRLGVVVAPTIGATDFPAPGSVRPRSATQTLLFYALLAPFTRTAGPAIAYPALYPTRHRYYPVDVGLDLVGIGLAPDDNLSSYNMLYPVTTGGTDSVPFMFGLYAQGGVAVALLGALVIGFVWCLVWRLVDLRVESSLERAMFKALLVMYGVFIAGDSARNSLLVSYGLAWPGIVLLAWLAIRASSRWRHRSAKDTERAPA
jgi:hypothetical protein